MPARSKAQFRAMAAAAEGKSKVGIPKSVGAEFLASMIGHSGSVKALPEKAHVTHLHVHIHSPSPAKRTRKPK